MNLYAVALVQAPGGFVPELTETLLQRFLHRVHSGPTIPWTVPTPGGIPMEPKLKHLEFIQGVVNRLASDSFRLKGWAVVLVAALFVLLIGQGRIELAAIGIVPVLLFWGLDGYFLWQERLFRALYDHVRELKNGEVDFFHEDRRFQDGMETVLDGRDSLSHVGPVLRRSHRGDRDRGVGQQFLWTIPWRVECSTAFTTSLTTGARPWFAISAALKATGPPRTTAGRRSSEAVTLRSRNGLRTR